jgi:hypothetical protein
MILLSLFYQKSYTVRWLYVDNVGVVCQWEIRRDLMGNM